MHLPLTEVENILGLRPCCVEPRSHRKRLADQVFVGMWSHSEVFAQAVSSAITLLGQSAGGMNVLYKS